MATPRPIRQFASEFVTAAGYDSGTYPEDLALARLIRVGLRPEQQFHIEGFRVDLAFPAVRIIVEVDGPTHEQSAQAVRDVHRDRTLRAAGWLVFRVSHDDVEEQISRVVQVVNLLCR